MKINIKELIITIVGVSLGATSILFAAPTATPPSSNIARPIHTITTGTQTQSKVGALISGDLVNRVLSLGSSTVPTSNKTVAVTGAVAIGTLSSSTDAFASLSTSYESGMTTVNPTLTTTRSDGDVIITSLGNPELQPVALCIQNTTAGITGNFIVLCP